MRLGRPRDASSSSGVAYCTGWFGRYEYSPWSATPPATCELKLTPYSLMSSGYSAKYVAVPVWHSERSAAFAQIGASSGPLPATSEPGAKLSADVGVPLMPEKTRVRLGQSLP